MGQYDWSGKTVMYAFTQNKHPIMRDSKRIDYQIDMRHWIDNKDSWEIREALENVFSGVPNWIRLNDDAKARKCWEYIRTFTYVADGRDFWQLPAETLRLRSGDCEDLSFLLASLLIGSGITPYHVRVVVGCVTWNGGSSAPHTGIQQGGHMWVVYKNLAGTWALMETTRGSGRSIPKGGWMEMDSYANSDLLPFYKPWMCLNNELAWSIASQDCDENVPASQDRDENTLFTTIALLDKAERIDAGKRGVTFI